MLPPELLLGGGGVTVVVDEVGVGVGVELGVVDGRGAGWLRDVGGRDGAGPGVLCRGAEVRFAEWEVFDAGLDVVGADRRDAECDCVVEFGVDEGRVVRGEGPDDPVPPLAASFSARAMVEKNATTVTTVAVVNPIIAVQARPITRPRLR